MHEENVLKIMCLLEPFFPFLLLLLANIHKRIPILSTHFLQFNHFTTQMKQIQATERWMQYVPLKCHKNWAHHMVQKCTR